MYKERKTSSKVCQEKWDENAATIHKEKLKTMKTSIDNASPKAAKHLENRRKRDQIKEERLSTIEKDNLMLLDKMMDIMKKPSAVNPPPPPPSKSLIKERNKKEVDKINQENQRILKKLTSAKAHYDRKSWDEFAEKQEKYLKNICEFPLVKNQQTKSFDSSLPKISTANRSGSKGFSSPERSSPSSPNATRKSAPAQQPRIKKPPPKEEYYSDDSLSLSDLDSASDEEFLKGIEKLKTNEKKSSTKIEKDNSSDLESLGSDFSDSFENDSDKEEKDNKSDKDVDVVDKPMTSSRSNKSDSKGNKKQSDDEDEKYDNEFEDDDEI